MKIQSSFSAMAVALVLIVAGLFAAHHLAPDHGLVSSIMGLGILFGAVTVTYKYPVAGTVAPVATTPPYSTVRGTVTATADADTTATITHNMNISTTAQALGQPEVYITGLTGGGAAAGISLWAYAVTNANVVTLTKQTTASSGNANPQIAFIVKRPHSIAI